MVISRLLASKLSGRELSDAAVGEDLKQSSSAPRSQIDDTAMLDHDALGRAGGAGGVDDVGEVV